MYKVVEKRDLAPGIHLLEIEAPMIAQRAKAGQFIMLMIDDKGERIPLTMADWNPKKGTVTIIALEAGKTTMKLGTVKKGDELRSIVGPLGIETHTQDLGTVACVGGGIGIALMYPTVRAMKQAGNKVLSIMGARTKDLLILEKEITEYSDEVHICTDDGSKGHHGFVSDILKKMLDEKRPIDVVYAVGPIIMMKVIADLTRSYGVKTIVSLNPIMVDGTGMCGSCRVNIDGKTKFGCVDGPDFDGHKVDFQLLIARNKRYLAEEKTAVEKFKKEVA
ncbi:MAG: sulfide/dihydroorotate dehydrogenase-like FAD/NAD-binding protein [Thermoplasmata archaeon]|nr:sulfide/dihydroorotate dehydrogenase-like FAD/NAD-binding protein [Thermoplasmata archaeon]